MRTSGRSLLNTATCQRIIPAKAGIQRADRARAQWVPPARWIGLPLIDGRA